MTVFDVIFMWIKLLFSLRKMLIEYLLWNSAFKWVYLSFSPLLWLVFFSQLYVRPSKTVILLFCISFLGDGLDPCLLYSVMNFRPQFIRHSVYQIQSLKSICHFHCIILKDLIQAIPEWSSGLLYFLQLKSDFRNEEFTV